MNLLLSIIVPIYNHKIDYLSECLDSLVKININNCEFILVDNGSTQESKDYIKHICESDKRFKIVKFENNVGYSNAINAGINVSTGTYIGILESDDFATRNGFCNLLEIAKKYDYKIDVIKGLYNEFCTIDNEKNFVSVNKFKIHQLNKILDKESIKDCNEYLMGHMCHWSAIYKKEFLVANAIKFNPNAEMGDIPFTIETWVLANSMYIASEYIVNYRRDNENSSLNQQEKTARRVMHTFDVALDWLRGRDDLDVVYKNKIIMNVFRSVWFNYHARVKNSKLSFLKFASKILEKADHIAPILENNLLNKEQKSVYKNIQLHPYWFMLLDFVKYKTSIQTLYFRGLFKIVKQPKKFGVLIFNQYLLRIAKNSPLDIHYHFIFNFFSVHYLYSNKAIGIRTFYFFKKPILKNKFFDKKGAFNLLVEKENFTQRLCYSLRAEIQAPLAHRWFRNFCNKHINEEVVCVACGPSLKFYERPINSIHFGVNRAFLQEKIKFDYILAQDFLREDHEKFNDYHKDSCIKLYGKALDKRLYDKEVANNNVLGLIPFNIPIESPYIYMLTNFNTNEWALDPSVSPISDFGGSVFSAMQFLAYTHPKRIYLVGCDCSISNHFYGGKSENFSGQIERWKKVKAIFDRFYPDIEIVSINPVGLKGLFRDIYTKEYYNNNLDLFVDKKEDLEII